MVVTNKMAEQPNEHQPLLNRNNDEEAESDPEQPPHVSQSEDLNLTSVNDRGNAETTPAILSEEGTFCVIINR